MMTMMSAGSKHVSRPMALQVARKDDRAEPQKVLGHLTRRTPPRLIRQQAVAHSFARRDSMLISDRCSVPVSSLSRSSSIARMSA
jgi:hypothetical protein